VAIGFARAGALDDLWDAAFRYNVLYADYVGSFKTTLKASVMGLDRLSPVGLSAMGLVGWMTGIAYLIHRGLTREIPNRFILSIAVVGLPIELALTGVSGRGYGHYYMTLLPVLALLAGQFWVVLLAGLEGLAAISGGPLRSATLTLVAVGLALASQLPGFYPYRSVTVNYRELNDPGVVEYIETNTSERDSVLVWGSGAVFNFEARRDSPTRFVYLDPLGLPGYSTVDMVEGFLAEVRERRPELILALAGKGIAVEELGFDSPSIQEAKEFLGTWYQPAGQVGSWMMYRHGGGS
jgi:hypothetical protein